MSDEPKFIKFDFSDRPESEMLDRAREFSESLSRRRSIRCFSPEPVGREIIEQLIRAAGSAPSGANRQPWEFVAVADHEIKRKIRAAAETEERRFYGETASDELLKTLSPLGTGPDKGFLEDAPWLVVVFALNYDEGPDGTKTKNYYVEKSVGISVGFLLAAVHQAGLCALVYTPPRMGFLNGILNRPKNRRPFAVIPVGRPAKDAAVPDIARKCLDSIVTFIYFKSD